VSDAPEPAWSQVLAAGDAAGFDRLVAHYAPRLWRRLVAQGQAPADADDIVQDTFLAAWDHRRRYDPQYAVTTWLYAIARNQAISQHRRRRRDEPLPAVHPATEPAPSPSGEGLWVRARHLLDERSFQALWLRFADDLDHAGIGAALGITAGHARVLIHRAKGVLAQACSPELSHGS
jgi:RNA polymerase sigma-70 factor, ECF subfamily